MGHPGGSGVSNDRSHQRARINEKLQLLLGNNERPHACEMPESCGWFVSIVKRNFKCDPISIFALGVVGRNSIMRMPLLPSPILVFV